MNRPFVNGGQVDIQEAVGITLRGKGQDRQRSFPWDTPSMCHPQRLSCDLGVFEVLRDGSRVWVGRRTERGTVDCGLALR